MTKNKDQAKGRIKQAAGDLTGNRELHREGRRQEAAGNAKETADKMKEKFDAAVDKVKDRMNED